MQCVRRLQVAWKIQEWKKMADGFEGWFALGCENDYEGCHFLTHLAKMLSKHDVKEQHSSYFKISI